MSGGRRLVLGLILCLIGAAGALAQTTSRDQGDVIMVAPLEGPISPATADFITAVIAKAETENAALLILEMDTPGGLDQSMRRIIKDILASPVPVVTYVTPSGGRAASAGAYILTASHFAAMSPGTNVGAATPVQLGGGGGGGDGGGDSSPFPTPEQPSPQDGEQGGSGEGGDQGSGEPAGPAQDSEDTGQDQQGGERNGSGATAPSTASEAKAIEDAAAYMRGLAELRDRNVELAVSWVREAKSTPAEQALEAGAIDLVAETRQEVIRALDGRTVETPAGTLTLDLDGLPVQLEEPGLITQVLSFLTHPNVAFILLNLGVTGIIIELWNPGSILPGALGALCLIMGLYALSVLPVNGAAAALLIIGALLAAAEAFTPTFGALAAGGLTLFVIGGIMLFPEGAQDMGVSRNLIFATAGTAAAILALILWVVVRGHSRRVSTGSQGMVGTPATVLNWQGGTGLVMAHGERWKAKGPQGLEPGDQVRVERLDGLTLSVQAEPPWRQS